MPAASKQPRLRLRLIFAPDDVLGPGKADLLVAIAETGSISGAARRMGMSYKKAWLLVERLNRMFAAPLVTAGSGGRRGGGAAVTKEGVRVLALYRRIEAKAERATGPEQRALLRLRMAKVKD